MSQFSGFGETDSIMTPTTTIAGYVNERRLSPPPQSRHVDTHVMSMIMNLQETISELRSRDVARESKLEALQEAVYSQRTTVASQQGYIELLHSLLRKTEDTLEATKSQMATKSELETSVKENAESFNKLKHDALKTRAEIRVLKVELAEATESVDNKHTQRMESFDDKLVDMIAKQKATVEAVGDLSGSLARFVEKQHKKNAEMQNKADDLCSNGGLKGTEFAELREKMDATEKALKDTMALVTKKNNALTDELASLKGEMKSSNAGTELLKFDSKYLDGDLERLSSKTADLKKETSSLREELDTLAAKACFREDARPAQSTKVINVTKLNQHEQRMDELDEKLDTLACRQTDSESSWLVLDEFASEQRFRNTKLFNRTNNLVNKTGNHAANIRWLTDKMDDVEGTTNDLLEQSQSMQSLRERLSGW